MEKLLLELIYGFTAGSLIVVFFIIFMAYELGKRKFISRKLLWRNLKNS
jgi:hypothetical protein